ncbi:MAG: prenyltransferase/squalene oxidase repeat-containing protein [Phycisphaerae bacterium]
MRRGLDWIAANQNDDGGWGDTVDSPSNISTTTLCWAALGVDDEGLRRHASAAERAEAWLRQRVGDLKPHALAGAIVRAYGDDRTFSAPILTMCILSGRFRAESNPWRLIPSLPFELAACPHRLFKWLRLSVVSYALPALIAIGQVRHHYRPTRNPMVRIVRSALRRRTLRVLADIQPQSGGFLEAAPLTGFVAMSLVAIGQERHAVTERAVSFLARTARPDGSWPIDTNLATWVTSLSVAALTIETPRSVPRPSGSGRASDPGEVQARAEPKGGRGSCRATGRARLPASQRDSEPPTGSQPHIGQGEMPSFSPDEASTVCHWLLDQQYHTVHPYTRTAPGGWAWTDLSGGVPDADDTAAALLALKALTQTGCHEGWNNGGCHGQAQRRHAQPQREGEAPAEPSRRSPSSTSDAWGARADIVAAAEAGALWLLNLRNRDGGLPTFCRGWGKLPFDRSNPDLTAHALRAWNAWSEYVSPALQRRIGRATKKALAYLSRVQRRDGAWIPLWFGNQNTPQQENPVYGTSRVLRAAADLEGNIRFNPAWRLACECGLNWLLNAQDRNGAWGGGPNSPPSIEETALAVEALAALRQSLRLPDDTPVDTHENHPSDAEADVERPPNPALARSIDRAIARGCDWIMEHTERGTCFAPAPIGLYFARLWYTERLYPLIFTVSALQQVCTLEHLCAVGETRGIRTEQ